MHNHNDGAKIVGVGVMKSSFHFFVLGSDVCGNHDAGNNKNIQDTVPGRITRVGIVELIF